MRRRIRRPVQRRARLSLLGVLAALGVAHGCGDDAAGPSGPTIGSIGPFPEGLTGSVAIATSRVVTTSSRAYTQTEVHVIDVANREDRVVYAGEDVYVRGLTWSPDNSRLVIAIFLPRDPGPNGETRDISQLRSVNLAGTEDRVIFDGPGPEGHPAYSAGGRLAYFAGWSGDPGTGIYVDGRLVHPLAFWGDDYVSWSPDGDALVLTGPSSDAGLRRLTLADGSLAQLVVPQGEETISQPAYAPDGLRIAFVRFGGEFAEEIWTVQVQGTDLQPLTTGSWPAWTPGSTYLAFARYGLQAGVYLIPPGGGTAERIVGLAGSGAYVQALSWSW